MTPPPTPVAWSFLTNHARTLLCIAEDPTVRLRELGDRVGVTERAVHRIVSELVAAGYLSRQRIGRRNQYTVHHDRLLPDRLSRTQPIGELLAILAPTGGSAGSSRPSTSPSTSSSSAASSSAAAVHE